MKKTLQRFGVALSIVFVSTAAHATILTFEITNLPFNSPIPQEYGDRVTSSAEVSGPFIFNYGQGNGFTPNVVVEYAADATPSVSTPNSWPDGYGDLLDVVWGEGPSIGFNNVTISLIADPGFDVVLNSFDIAAWIGDRQSETLEVVVDGSVLDLSTIVLGDNSHSTFNPGVSGDRIDLTFGNAWWLAVDNVNFDQRLDGSEPVPEPAALLLLAFGLVGLGFSRRRLN